MSKYTLTLDPGIRAVVAKKTKGITLNNAERRIIQGYYKGFWEKHENLKKILRQRRLEVIEELKKESLG